MRIERTIPQPPPPEFSMTFTADEGWAIVMALTEYAARHSRADRQDQWKQWARDLDHELRR